MKAGDFSSVLRALADTLGRLGDTPLRDDLVAFAALFDMTPAATVAAVVRRLNAIEIAASASRPTLGNLADIFAAAEPVFSKVAKPAILRDVELITQFLRVRPSLGLSDVIAGASNSLAPQSRARASTPQSIRSDLVNRYLSLLEESRGDEATFGAVFNQLKADDGLGRAEMVALAKAFTGLSAKSKLDGLKRIWNRHRDILTVRAKAAATAGRSAA